MPSTLLVLGLYPALTSMVHHAFCPRIWTIPVKKTIPGGGADEMRYWEPQVCIRVPKNVDMTVRSSLLTPYSGGVGCIAFIADCSLEELACPAVASEVVGEVSLSILNLTRSLVVKLALDRRSSNSFLFRCRII